MAKYWNSCLGDRGWECDGFWFIAARWEPKGCDLKGKLSLMISTQTAEGCKQMWWCFWERANGLSYFNCILYSSLIWCSANTEPISVMASHLYIINKRLRLRLSNKLIFQKRNEGDIFKNEHFTIKLSIDSHLWLSFVRNNTVIFWEKSVFEGFFKWIVFKGALLPKAWTDFALYRKRQYGRSRLCLLNSKLLWILKGSEMTH